ETIGTPAPVAEDRVDEPGDANRVENVAHEPRAADHCAGTDRRRAVCEGELKEIVRKDRNAGGSVSRRDADVPHENEALGRIVRIVPADERVAGTEHERKAPSPV